MPRRNANSTDVHIGKRIQLARQIARMTRRSLAARLELTFQQMQKYERGINRIPARHLWEIAGIVDQDMAWFIDGLSAPADGSAGARISDDAISLAAQLDRLTNDRRSLVMKIVQVCLEACQETAGSASPDG